MSCELLAGPSPLLYDGVGVYAEQPYSWVDRIGFVCSVRSPTSGHQIGTGIFNLDGGGFLRNIFSLPTTFYYRQELSNGSISWTSTVGLGGNYYGTSWDPLKLRPLKPYEANWAGQGGSDRNYGYGNQYWLITNWIGALVRLYRVDRPSRANYQLVQQDTQNQNVLQVFLSESDEPESILEFVELADRTWQIRRRNYSTLDYLPGVRYIVSPGQPIKQLWYSKRFQVIIALHTPAGTYPASSISVWSLTTDPTTLTVPVIDGPLVAGKATRVYSYLLGVLDEGAKGFIIDWTITGNASLVNTQSITDESGLAENWVIPTISAGGSNITVTVETIL